MRKTGAEFEIEPTVSDHWKGIRVEAITLKKKSAGFLNFIIKSEEVKKRKEKKKTISILKILPLNLQSFFLSLDKLTISKFFHLYVKAYNYIMNIGRIYNSLCY